MIGVGLEELGLEEFLEGKFFDGELYIDLQKKCYKDFNFKRLTFFSAMGSVMGKDGRAMISEGKAKGIGGNLKGDGMQTGGSIVVAAGGQVLLTYTQQSTGDHVALEDVLKALNITGSAPSADTSETETLECDEDACAMKK